MSRNNQDRVGSTPVHTEVSPAIQNLIQENQSSLSFVAPTEFIDLPSEGKFYSPSHPLHNQECVEIKYMTAKEEDILADKTLLKKGLAIDRLIKSVLVDRSIDPNTLLSGDRNAILVGSRINGYGQEYDTKVICPVCFSHGRHEFDLGEAKKTLPENLEELGIQATEVGTFIMRTPKMGASVECRLLTGEDEKRLLKTTERQKKLKLPETSLTNQLRLIILSVNGQTDAKIIDQFIQACPAGDSRYIRTTYQKCAPSIELKEEYVCGECGASTRVDVPFTTDFFWPQ